MSLKKWTSVVFNSMATAIECTGASPHLDIIQISHHRHNTLVYHLTFHKRNRPSCLNAQSTSCKARFSRNQEIQSIARHVNIQSTHCPLSNITSKLDQKWQPLYDSKALSVSQGIKLSSPQLMYSGYFSMYS